MPKKAATKKAATATKWKMPLGALPNPASQKDLLYGSIRPYIVAAEPPPKKFSLRSQMMPVINQIFGSCTGWATAGMKSQRWAKKTNQIISLGGRLAYGVAKSLDGQPTQEGTYPYWIFQALMGIGVPEEKVWPQISSSHADYIKLPDPTDDLVWNNAQVRQSDGYAALQNIDEMKHALLNEGAFVMSVPVYADYLKCNDAGIVQTPTGNFVGYHYICIIGYDDDLQCWEMQNSWGTSWGEKMGSKRSGRGWLPYSYQFTDAMVSVDFIDGSVTTGAPQNLALPVEGDFVVTQKFGADPAYYGKFGLAGHDGLDIRARTGAVIKAVDSGKVIWAAPKGGYGNCIIIQHTWGTSLYAHLQNGEVTLGAMITKGQRIATADATGNVQAGAAHLHLGFRLNGVSNPQFANYVDPEPYLRAGAAVSPDEGIGFQDAAHKGAKVYYYSLHNPAEFEAFKAIFKLKDFVVQPSSNLPSMPEKGFIKSHAGQGIIFYIKFAKPEQLAAIAGYTGAQIVDVDVSQL